MILADLLQFLSTTGTIVDGNSNELLKFTAVSSAVNELTITNAVTGSGPILSATGGDTNVNINVTPKGSGSLATTSVLADKISIGTGGAAGSPLQVIPQKTASGGTTASQSGTTVTASAATFAASDVGRKIVFANGTIRTITAYTSTTVVTVTASGTVSSQAFSINYSGLFVDTLGNVGIGSSSIPSGAQLYVYGGANGANLDVRGGSGATTDQATLELEGNDYDSVVKSVYLQYRGTNYTGTSFGLNNANLALLQNAGSNFVIMNVDDVPLYFGTNFSLKMKLTGTVFSPSTSDGVALGSTALMWSDVFLASGAVINFNNGDVTLTHSTDTLTLGGGNLALGLNSLTMTGSIGATGARVTKGWFTDLESTNTITGSVSGNSATATALATARTINGTSFDGTANITVTAAADTLTGTTLNSTVVTSSLTSLGTLTGLTEIISDSATSGTSTAVTFGHNSSGTAAAGYGSVYKFQLQSSTTANTEAGNFTWTWATATHASRKARLVVNVYDTSVREVLRGEASGSAAMIGFLGASAAVAQTGDAGTALVTFGLMSGTPTFGAGNLTGTTLAASVTASSLTSFGASIALGTPASGTLTNCTFPTLNQNTTGSAASLSISGQSGLLTFTGLASTNRAKTVRDAADTILELGGSYTPTGTWTNMPLTTPAITGLATGSGVASAATASTLMSRDSNANTNANNYLASYTTTATAAGTTTLTVSSTYQQFFTGSTTQTVKLPVTSTLVLGQSFLVVNNSSGVVTVQSSGSNTIQAMAASTSAIYTCISTSGTGASSWSVAYIPVPVSLNGLTITTTTGTLTIANGKTVTVNNTMTFAGSDSLTVTFTKVWRGLISQSGSSAPTATVLENTLGGTITWARSGAGIYTGTLSGAFTSNKTFFTVAPATGFVSTAIVRTDANTITIHSHNNTISENADDLLADDCISILVYP